MSIDQAIKDTDEQFAAAFNRGDFAAVAALHTGDVLELPPNASAVNGSPTKGGFMKAITSMFIAGAAVVATGAYGLQNGRANDHEYVPKAVATPLVEAPLSGAPGQIAVIKQLEMEPGWVGGRHFHTGDVFVYVVEGSIVFTLDGKAPMTLAAGETLHELPNQVMSAANGSSTDPLKIIVFQVNADDQPLMIKAD